MNKPFKKVPNFHILSSNVLVEDFELVPSNMIGENAGIMMY